MMKGNYYYPENYDSSVVREAITGYAQKKKFLPLNYAHYNFNTSKHHFLIKPDKIEKHCSASEAIMNPMNEIRVNKAITPLDWLERNRDIVKKFEGKWIAFTPEKGIIKSGTDPKKLFNQLHPEDKNVIIHYVEGQSIDLLI